MKTTPKFCRDCGTELDDGNRSIRCKSRCNACQRQYWEAKNRRRGHATIERAGALRRSAKELLEVLEKIVAEADGGWLRESPTAKEALAIIARVKGGHHGEAE